MVFQMQGTDPVPQSLQFTFRLAQVAVMLQGRWMRVTTTKLCGWPAL